VSWSVRGIYEGYMGWFDGDPVSMYAQSPQSIYADLVTLAGGAEKVISLAEQHLNEGDSVKALLLIEAAMATEPDNQAVLSMRLQILRVMRKASGNLNESGWLNHGIKQTQQKLSFSDDTRRK
jgi:alkyl sulfatase BDS1-like metallo-beta-lactamase superfamily hydrolase